MSELLTIRRAATAILWRSESITRHVGYLRAKPAWPSEAEFALEMCKAELAKALHAVEGALGEFEAKPVETPLAPNPDTALLFQEAAE